MTSHVATERCLAARLYPPEMYTHSRFCLTLLGVLALGCNDPEEAAHEPEPTAPRAGPDVAPTISAIDLHMDKLVYASGQFVSLEMTLGGTPAFGPKIDVALASTSGDVELVQLAFDGQRYKLASAVKLLRSAAPGAPDNGVLNVAAGEMFHAMFFRDAVAPEPSMIFDWGVMAGTIANAPQQQVLPALALTDDENMAGHKRAGTLLVEGGLPVQVATHELIVYPRDQQQLTRFLQVTGGSVLDQSPIDPEGADLDQDGQAEIGMGLAFLVAVDPTKAVASHLPMLRRLFEDTEPLFGSNAEVLGIYNLALALQAEGFKVGVNPRLQWMGTPLHDDPGELSHTMQNRGRGALCMPNWPSVACVENVPALWSHQSLMDADQERVNVAVLDMGFATNADFRAPAAGPMRECDMTPVSGAPVCGPGEAQGPPTVGNSVFGDRSWHGTGVVTTAGGVVDNGQLHAGVAGQTMVPMLYKYDFLSYAFEIGEGLRMATDDGASVINISGGYPCNILTTVGPDFDICTAPGRTGICLLVTASAHAAAAVACAAFGWFPGACEVAGAIAWSATGTCMATLALGDVSGPVSDGVRYATRNGVPVTTIAGNTLEEDDLPPVIQDLVDIDSHVTEDWGVIPAVIEPAIAVGSVDASLTNTNFFGEAVDLWAPIRSNFSAPTNIDDPMSPIGPTDIGGTSAAAPYVAGVIASMQAANPELDPRNPALDADDRRALVREIRDILLHDDNTWSDAEIVARGFATDPRRRKLVDPLSAVQSAAALWSFDVRTRGYDTTLGWSEIAGDDDDPSRAHDLGLGVEKSGTIVEIRDTDAPVTMPADRDYYEIAMPGEGLQRAEVALTYPSDPNGDRVHIELPDDSTASLRLLTEAGGEDTTLTYAIDAVGGSEVAFAVASLPGEDNLYRVHFAGLGKLDPLVDIIEPYVPEDGKLCADEHIRLRAHLYYPDSDEEPSDDEVYWTVNGAVVGSSSETSTSRPSGTYEITVHAGDSTDTVVVTLVDCVGRAPEVLITSPADDLWAEDGFVFDGYDAALGRYYADVSVKGWARDFEDGMLSGPSLDWYSLTGSALTKVGEGEFATLRLYAPDCTGTAHYVILAAEDSDGNFGYAVRVINVWDFC